MAVSRALRRLLRIRTLEEEQSQRALESALGELDRLQKAMTATGERARHGRRLVSASVQTGELRDRISGLEETHAAHRHADALSARIESSEVEVEQLRQSFLLRRIERRQAETLIEVTRARDGAEAERRGQQGLDDRHGSLVFRANAVGVRTKKIAGVSAELPPDAPNGESHGRET